MAKLPAAPQAGLEPDYARGVDAVAQFLVAVAAIFLIGAVGEMVFAKTFVPDAIWLIITGVLLGPVLGWVTREQLAAVAPHFAALTLVVVLFEGGSRIRLKELAKVAPRAGLLAVLTFAFAVVVIALAVKGAVAIGWLPASWTWGHALMVGCILGGPSSIIIMPAMERAKLDPSLAGLVGLESAITDAFCVVGTAAAIDILVAGDQASSPAMSLVRSFGLALVIGAVSAFAWLLFLRLLRNSEHAYPITLSVLLLLYVAIDAAGGSAALGILTVAIILGNAPSISQKFDLGEGFELGQSVQGVNRHVAFIIKSLFFTFMGLMLGPPWGLLALGALFGLLLFLARVPAALLATLGSEHREAARKMVILSMPRGMAAGVLATMPTFAGVADTEQLPVVVFACIVTTILIFAGTFPLVRKQLPTLAEVGVGAAGKEAGGDALAELVVAQGKSKGATTTLRSADALAPPQVPHDGALDPGTTLPSALPVAPLPGRAEVAPAGPPPNQTSGPSPTVADDAEEPF
ncbi:MAG: cation:proton antiporter [Polyangiaceae bacterium]